MSDKDPFYVGYLPLPAGIKRFLLPWLVGNFVMAVGVAVVLASNHREPGDGVWDTSEAVEVRGWLELEPYPVLHGEDRKIYFPVEIGKLGSQERLDPLGPGLAIIKGFVIERDGRAVLEIDPTQEDAVIRYEEHVSIYGDNAEHTTQLYEKHDRLVRMLREQATLGIHTLRGEIVDPKCYLGVMQPGDGKTHKTCATLCIKGGIPPMFLVRDAQGNTAAYLLTDAGGNAFPESHHEYIADPIELTGKVLRDGDLLVLRADLGSIRRLGHGD